VPSDNTGKVILSLTYGKKKVSIRFEDGSTVDLSERGYSQLYLYQGKSLSSKEYTILKEAEAFDPFHLYLHHMFARGRYSEQMIRQKLYARKAQRYQVEALIAEYKTYGLIDDESLVKEWVEYYHEKHIGFMAMKRKLEEKGFSSELVNRVVQPQNEEEKAQKYIPLLLKKTNHLPIIERKQRLYGSLLAKGFDHSVIVTVLDGLTFVEDEAVDHHGKKLFQLAKRRYSRTLHGRLLEQRLISYMRSKGYTMNKINVWLGEEHDHD
jgi:SOS response regulatory protein OraA/RecX